MHSMTPDPVIRDYDAEVAEMLMLATALTGSGIQPKLVDLSVGIAGDPGIAVITTTTGEREDADA